MTTSAMSGPLVERMVRAARLDSNLYEEVEADRSATTQAALAVGVVAVLQGIGVALSIMFGNGGGNPVGALVGGLIGAFLTWVIWSYLTYFIGTRLFGGSATPGELLRTLGFAQAPRALNVLAFLPVVGGLVVLVTSFWTLAASIVAIRQALDVTTGKAVLTALVGWLVLVALELLLRGLAYGALTAANTLP